MPRPRLPRKLGDYDVVFAGRQAIDGDNVQVGPQTAEKLGIPQITYAEEIVSAQKDKITVKRKIDGGFEVLEGTFPPLITVVKDAATPRPFMARRVMAYKNGHTPETAGSSLRAPSFAWRFLPGASPGRARASHPPVASVAPKADGDVVGRNLWPT